jgi:hypothetical protein
MSKVLYFCFLIVLLASCRDSSAPVLLHQDYFPLQSGDYVIYDAKEVFHDDDSDIHDTTVYLLKVKVGPDYMDLQGRLNKEYYRYKSIDQGATWITADVWYAYADAHRGELIEENQRKVKIVFAPGYNKEWDVNAYNTRGTKLAYFEDVHEAKTFAGVVFDSTVKVIEEDFFSLVDYKIQYEIYAKKLGLVQKYYKDLVIENFDTLRVKTGNEIFLNYRSNGTE